MANSFTGFPPDAVDFLAKLEANNDRAWFNAHKSDYEHACKEPMQQLLDDLDQKFGTGSSKLFRIHRDVRFSKDKTPYKTWQAAHFAAGYLSLSPDGLYVGTGAYMLDGPTLERYRRAVADDRTGAELVKVQTSLKKKGYVVEGHGDALKIVPRGYPKDHPRAELLKQKSVLVGKNFDAGELNTPALVGKVTKVITDIKPLTNWLDANVWA
jgi:uncharacterized protein (TIGR02453 family)